MTAFFMSVGVFLFLPTKNRATSLLKARFQCSVDGEKVAYATLDGVDMLLGIEGEA